MRLLKEAMLHTGNIKGDEAQESELDKWIKKIRLMLENPLEDPIEFLDEFKMNLFSSEDNGIYSERFPCQPA